MQSVSPLFMYLSAKLVPSEAESLCLALTHAGVADDVFDLMY